MGSAGGVLWHCSAAASFVVGQSISVDGGFTMRCGRSKYRGFSYLGAMVGANTRAATIKIIRHEANA